MSIPVLTQVYDEVRRLSIAGSVVAAGDFRLKKLIPPLEAAGQKAPVFAKVAQAVQAVPSNFVNRIEFDASLLIRNSQTLVPSVAPNNPPLTVPLAGFIDWLAPNPGGAGDSAAHTFVAVLYDAPAIAVPPELPRRKA